ITSAPKSARVCVQAGPAITRVKSTTSRPSRAVGAPGVRGARSGNCGLAVMIGSPPRSIGAHRQSGAAQFDLKVYFQKFTGDATIGIGGQMFEFRWTAPGGLCSPDEFAPIQ